MDAAVASTEITAASAAKVGSGVKAAPGKAWWGLVLLLRGGAPSSEVNGSQEGVVSVGPFKYR